VISIGIDIGGTFTDVVAFDWETLRSYTLKVPTTSPSLADGITDGVRQVLRRSGRGPGDVDRFVHGTTVATNVVLEERGAAVALLTTLGFEDVLEIGRLNRTQMYDLMMDCETPVFLAPRRRRRGIKERMYANGAVDVPFDSEQAERVVRDLVKSETIEAFAVCFLHAFAHPDHERAMRDVIAKIAPGIPVSISSDVDPMFREYERTVVTGFDAYVRPAVETYIRDLVRELKAVGIDGPLQVMQSMGGIAKAESVITHPVSVLLSGPAAGAIGGAFAAQQSNIGDVITIDVGGTSADVTLVEDGRPLVSSEGHIGAYPIRVPMVDTTTVGAGGGSIAWVDSAGRARVGPRSAGAFPGPACYGRGGTAATVTDAGVVLGYLNCEYFAGGTVRLDYESSVRAVGDFGSQLGLSLVEAACGIHRIVNSHMADAIRRVSIKRGYDPRNFALVLLGGAGAVHGGRLAAELGIRRMLVPTVPGVLSALGLLVAGVEHTRSAAAIVAAETSSEGFLERTFELLEASVREEMLAEGVTDARLITRHLGELRYVGQSYSLEVPIEMGTDKSILRQSTEAFHAKHHKMYGHSNASAQVEFVALRVIQTWSLPRPEFGIKPTDGLGRPAGASRSAYFEELAAYVETPVLHRDHLVIGEMLTGPLIVEQDDTTLVVYPGDRAVLESSGNIIVHTGASSR
jgi:N-methylhydantoinase A